MSFFFFWEVQIFPGNSNLFLQTRKIHLRSLKFFRKLEISYKYLNSFDNLAYIHIYWHSLQYDACGKEFKWFYASEPRLETRHENPRPQLELDPAGSWHRGTDIQWEISSSWILLVTVYFHTWKVLWVLH